MTLPIISAYVAAVLIILQQALMLAVGMYRTKTGVGMGFAEDRTLERLIRRHGNLAENAALFVAVLAILEMTGAPSSAITGFGAVFVLARILHAIGFSTASGSFQLDAGNKAFLAARAVGATATALCGMALGGYVLYWLLTV